MQPTLYARGKVDNLQAAHTHSPKAAQGMNVSMHDAFNLAWKLNLTIRGLAKSNLLSTYELERRKIAQDLITFDYDHANAFSAGDPKALAENFTENICFISGVGAEYAENVLNRTEKIPQGGLRAGSLLSPAKVTRYIDANPVDLQLDIPMLGQFRIFFFTPNVKAAASFLGKVCEEVVSSRTVLGRVSAAAEFSYAALPPPSTEMDEFVQPQRYTCVSKCFTYALVTTMPKKDIEIADLPPVLQESRWTFYLDDVMKCTEKWLGEFGENEVAIVNVRPDAYVGSIGRWNALQHGAGDEAVSWLEAYYGGFLTAENALRRE
jgi:phenol 2-monooxygenase